MKAPDDVVARWREEARRALPAAGSDLVEEIALHLAERWAASRAAGTPIGEADQAAHADLDAWRLRTRARPRGRLSAWSWATSGLGLDLKAARRALTKRPGAAVGSVLLVALATTANLAVFAITYGVLGRPLPYPQPDRLMTLWQSVHGDLGQVSYPDLTNLRETGAFETSGALLSGFGTMAIGSTFDRVQTVYIEPAVLTMLGARPIAGRLLAPDDSEKPLVMISHRLWRSRFGGDPAALGRSFSLSGVSYAVVGILPPGFGLELPVATAFTIEQPDVWMALDRTASFITRREVSTYEVLARLAPGLSTSTAQSMIDARGRSLQRDFATTNHDRGFRLVPLADQMSGRARTPLALAFVGGLMVLIAALANLTTLALSQLRSREPEQAVRRSLGATPWRANRPWLIESLIASAIGGAAGTIAAVWLTTWLIASRGAHLPRVDAIRFDLPVLLYGLCVLALVGVTPTALCARLARTGRTLRPDERIVGRSTRRSRRLLVAGELAVALVLSTSAALLGLTVARLLRIDPGFETNRALAMRVSAYATRHPTQESTVAFFTSLADRAKTLVGVDDASVVFSLPLSAQFAGTDVMSEERPLPPAQRLNVGWDMTSPGYFHTVGIPIIRGRDFRSDDRTRSHHPTIISESVAHALFGEADPIGRYVSVGESEAQGDWHEIIGVVGDVRHTAMSQVPSPRVYDAFGPHWERTMFLVVRARPGVEPESLTSVVRATVAAADADAPVFEAATLAELVDRSVAAPHLAAVLAAGLAGGSILLALVGTFAVVACSVSERQSELGVRVALGATARGILALILGDALWTAIIGCGIGAAGAAAAAKVLEGQLFGIRLLDAAGLIIALAAGLGAASLVAAWWPARRAASVDPLVSIRE